MGTRPLSFLSIVFLVLLLAGCAGTLAEFEPQTGEQQAVKQLLVEWQSTWNNGDVEGNLDLYDEEASIMYGSDRKMASKQEYRDILPQRMEAHPKMALGEPRIEVRGDTATARFGTDSIPFHNELLFRLVKRDGRWLISSWQY